MEETKANAKPPPQSGAPYASEKVVPFRTQPAASVARREPHATDEELAEYRRIRPLLMQMLREWPEFRAQWKLVATTCPVAKRIIEGD